MRIGIRLPNVGGLASGGAREFVWLAEEVERLGFDSVWLRDRLAVPMRERAGPGWRTDCHEPLALLAGIAARTSRIALGTIDLALPLRNPLFVAKAVSTLDCIARGRVILGVSAGASEAEFEALGVASRFASREDVTDEWIEICQELWRESDEPSRYDGRFADFQLVGAYPKPVQQPHLPIYVSVGYVSEGNTAAARRAARYGAGVLLAVDDPAELREAVEPLTVACEQAGRDFDEIEVCVELAVERNGEPATVERIQELGDAGAGHAILVAGHGTDERPTPDALLNQYRRLAEELRLASH